MTSAGPVATPNIIAHRGFAGAYPENTIRAVRAAAAHDGVSMVEVDVVPTSDGTVVCFHDDDLHQTTQSRGITNERGTVWETDSESVLNANVLGTDATVPRFESVLDALPEGIGINVELKNPGTTESTFATALDTEERRDERELWAPFVTDVIEILDEFQGQVLVSSFYEGALAALMEEASDVPVGVLVWDSLSDGLEIARRYDTAAIHPPWNLVRGTPFAGSRGYLDSEPEIDINIVETAHADGRAVNVWTVDTWYRAHHLIDAGVDGLIADYPCIGNVHNGK